jgi:Ca2+-transporting ATPase
LLALLRRRNAAFWWVAAATAAMLAAILSWPPTRGLFHFGPLHPRDVALVLASAVVILGGLELAKRLLAVRRQG